MADKEIIIDGVDVRKCKHFKAWYESRPNGFGGITIENYCYLYKDNCEKYPQCLYRSNQLQQLETQLKRKEQECEELKQELQELEKDCPKRCKSDKYKQALDEIENIADDYNRVEKTSQYYREGFDEIQDIINKVKK